MTPCASQGRGHTVFVKSELDGEGACTEAEAA